MLCCAQVHTLLLEMEDKLDSVAYGSHLVDVGESVGACGGAGADRVEAGEQCVCVAVC